jgi:chemotaxis protein CheD
MIYFGREFQERLLGRFLSYLAPDGYLILGHSENVSWMPGLEPLGRTIYRPAPGACPAAGAAPRKTVLAPTGVAPAPGHKPTPRQTPARSATRGHAGATPGARPAVAGPGAPAAAKRAIVAGEVFASRDAVEITTLLGSCIAACLYDPTVGAGGMNHFLLPEGRGDGADTACYGINAMELLINELMKLGGDRGRMVARLYGGARVLGDQLRMSRVGEKNTEFVRKYLTTEGIPILDQNVGGGRALRIAMQANTGEVVATELEAHVTRDISNADDRVAVEAQAAAVQPIREQVTLF